MKILVIGGTGFIGTHVFRRLVGNGHNVAVFHRGQTETELLRSVQHIYGKRKYLSTFLADFKKFAPDVVLDLIPYVEQDALILMDTFCSMAKRVVAISSMDVYAAYGRLTGSEDGEPEQMPFDGDGRLRSTLYRIRRYDQATQVLP